MVATATGLTQILGFLVFWNLKPTFASPLWTSLSSRLRYHVCFVQCFMEPLKKVQVEGFLMFAEPQDLFGNLDELCYVSQRHIVLHGLNYHTNVYRRGSLTSPKLIIYQISKYKLRLPCAIVTKFSRRRLCFLPRVRTCTINGAGCHVLTKLLTRKQLCTECVCRWATHSAAISCRCWWRARDHRMTSGPPTSSFRDSRKSVWHRHFAVGLALYYIVSSYGALHVPKIPLVIFVYFRQIIEQ